jgi:hypothetical protein
MASFVSETWEFLKGRPDHPIYRREQRGWSYIRAWRSLRRGCLPLIAVVAFGFMGCCGLAFLPIIGSTPESWPIGLLAVIYALALSGELVKWVTGLAATGLTATMISAEVEAETYGLLRLTLIPSKEIVLAKYAAAMRELRQPIGAVIVLRIATILAGVVTILIFVTVGLSGLGPSPSGMPSSSPELIEIIPQETVLSLLASGAAAIIVSIGAAALWLIFFLVQPILDALLYASVGIFASTMSRTRSGGLFMAGGVRVGLWALSYVASQFIGVGISLLTVPMTGIPAVALWLADLQNMSPGTIIIIFAAITGVSIVVVAAVQVSVIMFMLQSAVRRAEALPFNV